MQLLVMLRLPTNPMSLMFLQHQKEKMINPQASLHLLYRKRRS